VPFETLPLVHWDAGRLPELPGEEPERALTRLARRFGRVVVVDVQGVKRNQADLEGIQAAARKRPVWVDAGSRYATDAMDLFIAGAESVTLRWNTLASPDELREVADLCAPESVHVALEHPHGAFLRHPRDGRGVHDAARLADSLGFGVVHVVDRFDPGFLRSLPQTTGERRVMGPLPDRAAELEELGFTGLLVPADLIQEEKEAAP
jgi:hypothetical protein